MAAVDVEVHTDSVEVVTDKVLTIVGSDTVNTTTNGTKTVDVQGNNYVLTSTGMYTGSMTGNIPTWLDEAITAKIVDGTVTLSQALSDLTTYVQNMEDGVNQSIVNLHNADENLNALYTTIKTSNDNNIAAISDLQLTKVDADSATAIAEQVVGSEFAGTGGGVASSWFLENIQTYADNISANTTTTTALASSINDPDTGLEATADIIKTGYTTVGLNDDGTLNAGAGELGKIAVSMGTQTVSIDSEDTITIDEEGDYTATASKFLSDGDGAVVGWTASLIDDGVSKTSDLTFKADTFKIQATDSAYSPIEVDTTTGKLKFTGNVSFAGLGINGDSTTIDGGNIKAGSSISAPIILGGDITGTTLTGAVITGAQINGAVIKASWIDKSTTSSLTNWKHYTPDDVPDDYKDNFAKDNVTGELVTDSEGYVRLPGMDPAISHSSTKSYDFSNGYKYYDTVTGGISVTSDTTASYDYYKSSNNNRAIRYEPSSIVNGSQVFIQCDDICFTWDTDDDDGKGGPGGKYLKFKINTTECKIFGITDKSGDDDVYKVTFYYDGSAKGTISSVNTSGGKSDIKTFVIPGFKLSMRPYHRDDDDDNVYNGVTLNIEPYSDSIGSFTDKPQLFSEFSYMFHTAGDGNAQYYPGRLYGYITIPSYELM